jgi:hypothetical protein
VRTTEKAYAKQLDALETEFDVCLESLGGKYLTAALARLAPMGRMVRGCGRDATHTIPSICRNPIPSTSDAPPPHLPPYADPIPSQVHFGATAAYGGSSVDGLRKWLKLVPNYLRRPLVDPGELVPRNIVLQRPSPRHAH